jgi:hypothetical protein
MVEDIAADIMAKNPDLATREWLGSDERSEAIWDLLNRARRENGLDDSQFEFLRGIIEDEVSKLGVEQ